MSATQREWFEKDYYAVLGVPPDATQKDITRAYRQLARDNHPDANPGDTAAEDRFKEVAVAYDVIGDEKKRKDYDEIRSAVKTGNMTGGSFGGFSGEFTDGDLGDLFGNLFGSPFTAAGPQRGADTTASVAIDFVSSLQGEQVTLVMDEVALCEACKGSGAASGTSPVVCHSCGGSGSSAKQKGFFSFASPCRDCGGQGNIIASPCQMCAGSGVTRIDKEVAIRIPAGVENGKRIRLKGMGGRGSYGAPAGDLYVTVNVLPHEWFSRSGDNILVKVPVALHEAALGATIKVPLPLGGSVGVKVPEGTPNGRVLRVKGHGAQGGKGGGSRGDLLVEVEVVYPTELSSEARELIQKLGEVIDENPRRRLFGEL